MTAFYEAIDGSLVELPELARPWGDMPEFSHDDLPWFAEAIPEQKRSLKALRALNAEYEDIYADRVTRAEMLLKEGHTLFGADGAGFLTALNGGALWDDFWRALAALIGREMDTPIRMSDRSQEHVAQLLRRLPQPLRVQLIAQAFQPVPKPPRKSEAMFNLIAEELAAPGADLRQWEVGVPKYQAVDDMPDKVLIGVAALFMRISGQFEQFARHAADTCPDKKPFMLSRGRTPGLVPVDRVEALAILCDVPIAKRHGEGMTQADANFYKTQAFHKALRALQAGVPEGHLMHLALSKRIYGPTFPKVVWTDFSREAIWPYIATHLDIVERALEGQPLPWEPKLEPIKALKTLAYLPKLPLKLATGVERFAKTGTKAQKATAKALLSARSQGGR